MANIKSQIKRNKQNEGATSATRPSARRSRPRPRRSRRPSPGDAEAATAAQREAARALDKAASKGVVHKRTAARSKSRLAKAANAVAASA